MKQEYKFCPYCTGTLSPNKEQQLFCNPEEKGCGWIHYDNPVPAVVTLVPFPQEYIGGCQKDQKYEGSYRWSTTGVLLVQRGVPPFVGEWCLPGGYMDTCESPQKAAVREVLEETGIHVRLEQLLCAYNPLPGELNQVILSYLARPVRGALRAGDDAQNVGLFGKHELPEICFQWHKALIDKWYGGELGVITGNYLKHQCVKNHPS